MNSSEIQSLTSEVERLAPSVDWWNSTIVWIMFVAAFAAAGLVVTQYIAFQRAKQLGDLQGRLGKLKELQLVLDLKGKDQKIAEAQERAATAQKTAEGFKRDIANANQRAAEANEKAEKERLARLKLEQHVVARRLSGSKKANLVKLLTQHPDSVAIVSTMLDSEGTDFADDFDSTLREANWQTVRIRNHISNKHGVSVGTVVGTELPGTKRLAKALTAIGITCAEVTFAADDHSIDPWFQPGVIYLVIDRKPELAPADR